MIESTLKNKIYKTLQKQCYKTYQVDCLGEVEIDLYQLIDIMEINIEFDSRMDDFDHKLQINLHDLSSNKSLNNISQFGNSYNKKIQLNKRYSELDQSNDISRDIPQNILKNIKDYSFGEEEPE